MKKKAILSALMLLAALGLSACGGDAGGIPVENAVRFTESGAEISGSGLSVSGRVVTISQPGSYTVSGKTTDGQLVVDVPGEGAELRLVLDGAEITNLSGPAIHIKQGKDLELRLAEGSENTLTSGTAAMSPDGNSSGAALYAEDDMEIDGDDSAILNVNGYINNGIACKNDLDIKAGQIRIKAVNNGLRGSDSVEIKGGSLRIEAGNDGVKSTTADKEGKGYIAMAGGSLTVSALGDGISAETQLNISGGSVDVKTTGDPQRESCKGMKANGTVSISGGSIKVYAEDHALQSEGDISIAGGELDLTSNVSKAIKVDGELAISGGTVNLFAQEDAVDSIGDVRISNGLVYVRSVHDGIQAGEANSGKGSVTISGGTVLVDAYKLGFNPRGELRVTGGTVLALSGTEKTLPGEGFHQLSWNGVKGDEVNVSTADTILGKLNASYGYRQVLVGGVSGPCTVTGGTTSVTID